MGLLWYGTVLTWDCFGLGLFWFGTVSVGLFRWDCFGLGLFHTVAVSKTPIPNSILKMKTMASLGQQVKKLANYIPSKLRQ